MGVWNIDFMTLDTFIIRGLDKFTHLHLIKPWFVTAGYLGDNYQRFTKVIKSFQFWLGC